MPTESIDEDNFCSWTPIDDLLFRESLRTLSPRLVQELRESENHQAQNELLEELLNREGD